LPLFPTSRHGALPFRIANLAPFLEDLLHEVIAGEDPTRTTPILGTARASPLGNQGADLFLKDGHSFFKRHSGHSWTPASKETALWLFLTFGNVKQGKRIAI
jgi:hypothetical protein